MKKLLSIAVGVMFVNVFVIASIVVAIPPTKVSAESADQSTSKPSAQDSTKPTTYTYAAQAGDSYSLMARKAIQTYGITNKVTLSQAKIIYAETNLTQQAGSPILNLGQAIEIKQDTVKNWIDNAQKLSPNQEAAWQVYTAGVNFNTNAVGQPKQ